MKEQPLKKWVMKRMGIYGGILFVMFFILVTLRYERISLKNKRQSIISETSADKIQLANLQTRAAEIANATEVWGALPEKNKNVSGLLIDQSKNVFDTNAKLYYITGVEVNFSTPTQLAGEYKKDTTAVISSDVTMKFKGLSDQYLVSFVEGVMNGLPGYKIFYSLKLSRQSIFSPATFEKIKKGEETSMVVGELRFQWNDLQDLTHPGADTNADGNADKVAPAKEMPKK